MFYNKFDQIQFNGCGKEVKNVKKKIIRLMDKWMSE